MPESSIPIPGTNQLLESYAYTNTRGKSVHREGVFIGDGDSDVKANVTSGGSLQVFTDPAQLDAFARLRVSNPETLFDSKQIHNDGALFWDDQEVSGSGTGTTWTQNTASTVLDVSATTAGNRVRQTFRRFNYQPGKSQLVLLTGTLASGGGTGITRCMGLYDDKNGIFARDNEGAIEIVKRAYITGAAVDTAIAQADWNLDPLDGTGPSGVTLDASKSQILLIDLEWLGVGRVRVGWVVDGLPIYCHEFLHANNVAGVYMSTPNLPLRYEIENDGTGAASELEAICGSVMSEGGTQDIGTSRYHSNGVTHVDANAAGTIYALCGVRLKSGNIDGVVKLTSVSCVVTTATDIEWLLVFNPTVAGTPSWTNLTNSIVQTSVGATANTVTNGTVIAGGYLKSTNQAGTLEADLDTAQQLGSAIDGTPDEVWLCARPIDANADVHASISWKEIS